MRYIANSLIRYHFLTAAQAHAAETRLWEYKPRAKTALCRWRRVEGLDASSTISWEQS